MLTHHDRLGEEIFEAWIEDDSKERLKEYKRDFLGKKNTVTTYVKSVMDQKFKVCVQIVESDRHPILRALCCDLTIDGQCVSSYFLGKWNSHRVDTGITFEDVDGGPGEVIPLQFGQTVLHVDGTADEELLEELGSIRLDIYPVRIKEPRAHYKHRIQEDMAYEPGKVHPLKAHSAKYEREAYSGKNRMYYKTERIHPDRPLATFIFKYRCQVALELMEILPRKVPFYSNPGPVHEYKEVMLDPSRQQLEWIRDRCLERQGRSRAPIKVDAHAPKLSDHMSKFCHEYRSFPFAFPGHVGD